MKRNSFFGGHVPSFMSPCACIIASLMALASTGAYASTKSAAEGEVNTPVEALIPMAKYSVGYMGIDTDYSHTINNEYEMNELLAATTSNSLEDIISDKVNKKVSESDTEKMFTTFITTNNLEQVERNIEILNSSMDRISVTYDKIIEGVSNVNDSLRSVSKSIFSIRKLLNNLEIGTKLSEEDADNVISKLYEIEATIKAIANRLFDISQEYKNITEQDFLPMLKQQENLKGYISYIENQIAKLKNSSVEVNYDLLGEVEIASFDFTDASISNASPLKDLYNKLKEDDIKLLQTLLDKQTEFSADSISSAEEQAASKELLKELVDNASPMTRNFILKLAEEQYKPENDPTGINDVNTSAKVDGNVYKTATEIYRLDGQSVTVYDYSGKLLRTEPLDLKIHTGFAQ